jgi:hypothetical protein
MADPCATYTFGSVTINGAETTDTLITPDFDSISGLDGAPVRRQIDPVSQSSGDLNLQGEFFAGRVIVFKGILHIGTLGGGTVDPTNPLWIQKIITLQKAVVAACEAQLSSSASLAWTDSAGASRSITCFYGLPGQTISFGGSIGNPTFDGLTLWAPNPTISG